MIQLDKSSLTTGSSNYSSGSQQTASKAAVLGLTVYRIRDEDSPGTDRSHSAAIYLLKSQLSAQS